MYGTLEQDLPDIGKSGGKLTFATTELNTAYSFEHFRQSNKVVYSK